MVLRLLTPNQIRDAKGQEIARSLIRAQETEEVVKRSNESLAKAEMDFANALAKKQQKWEEEEEEHKEEVESRLKEIQILEQKKLNLLIPLDIINQPADTKRKEAEKFLKELQEREERVDELTDLLEEKLDSVGGREASLKKEIHAMAMIKEGISRQELVNKQSSERLTLEMKNFYAHKSEEEAKLDKKNTEMSLAEINMQAKLDKFQRDKTALLKLEKQLEDERATLGRAWEEFQKLKNNT